MATGYNLLKKYKLGENMSYEPNLTDPRIRRRCEKALDWTITSLPNRPLLKSRNEIQTHFGNGSRQPGRWLRELLLINVDPYWNKDLGICKRWQANKDGIHTLELLLGRKNAPPKVEPVIEQQLTTGTFVYKDKSDRLFNPVQFIPTRLKRPLLAKHGMDQHYDIKAAAVTLIKQYALQCGLTKSTPAIDLYLADRTSIRQRIARDSNLSENAVKKIINALFQGAKISHSIQSGFLAQVDFDHSKVSWFQQDEFIIQLRQDIKTCWTSIRTTLPVRTKTDKNGRERRVALTPKDKSVVYLKLERQVLNEVKKYLKKKKMKFLLEHDGWSCDKAIDLTELITHVRTKTGFMIDIDWEIYE